VERIAHRGAKTEWRENTIAAFVRAFERGADAIELDVHATRDGVVVVHHDERLGGWFGPLAGRAIADLDAATLDLARDPSSADERIPTLGAVLGSAPPSATVYVELKGHSIEALVAAVIRESAARCAVHSFDHAAVAAMRSIAPSIPRGILFERGDALARIAEAMAETGACDVWLEWSVIDEALVGEVHAAGGRVIAWTVNTRRAAERLVAIGVDGLCTDDVRLLDGL
jgi:glycerophosphoryl diester phosphodiesterase